MRVYICTNITDTFVVTIMGREAQATDRGGPLFRYGDKLATRRKLVAHWLIQCRAYGYKIERIIHD